MPAAARNLFKFVEHLSVNDSARLLLMLAEARRQAAHAEGDFIEMGVFRGGSALLLAYALKEQGSPHRLHLLDSWEGMPPPQPEDAGAIVGEGGFADSSEEMVRDALDEVGLLDRCTTYQGWFEQTLPALQGPFGLAHVDCDFYEPMKFCLQHLLTRMTPQGTIVIDDFGNGGTSNFPGVSRAVHEVVYGTPWRVVPLGGARDESVLLLRTGQASTAAAEQIMLL